jgi:6-phosphogluconolactonase
MHPAGSAYTNNEMGLSVTTYRRDVESGGLTELQTISTVPEGTSLDNISTSEMFIEPQGKWLYVSNRGVDTITVFAIGTDGTLTTVERVASPAEPRGFGISPDGRWLLAAGQNDDTIVVFAIDQDSGRLTRRGATIPVPRPVCVEFVRQPF